MKRRQFVQGIAAAGASRLGAAPRTAKLEEAAELMRQAADSDKVRAATLYVEQDDFTFARAFGKAGTPDTIFLIASITKPMTATGVMVLADRGELSLADPVKRFIPEFSTGARSGITIRNLLTHTSGLPDQLPENVALRKRHAPLSEFVDRAIRTPLLFEPGAKVSYQSMGFLLAAEVARRITGTPFPRFLLREVFQPLAMNRTALGLGRFSIPETAQCQVDEAPGLYGGGSADEKPWHWNSPYWRNLAAPWGGAHSTGPDIARFLTSFLRPDGAVLKEATAKAMIVNQTEGLNRPWGLGFMVKPGSFGSACSPKAFGHSGSTGTIAWADPASTLVCVVLTTLPARVSAKTLLKPVSNRVSEAAPEDSGL